MSRSIKVGIFPIVYVRVELPSNVKEPIVLDAMRGSREVKTFSPNRIGKFAQDIAFGAHLARTPIRQI